MLAFVPFVGTIVLLFGAVLAVGVGTSVPGGAELLVVLFLVVPLVVARNVGLGAVGGYLGVYLREGTDL